MCTGFELVLPEIFGGAAAAEAGLGLGAAAVADAGLASGLVAGGASFGGAALGAGEALGAFGALGGLGAAAEAGIGSGIGLGLGGGDLGAGLWAGAGDAGEYIFGGGAGDGGLASGLVAGDETFGGLSPDMIGASILGSSNGFALSGLTALSGGGPAPGLFDQALGAFQKYGQPAMSVYSGITGLQRAAQMRKMAALAARRSDPWGQSGGRALADTQLQELMRDPSRVAASDPAFKLRVMGAQRANAQFGQDSGAMSVAGANASQALLDVACRPFLKCKKLKVLFLFKVSNKI